MVTAPVDVKDPKDLKKVSKVEHLKERSHALREPIATEILQDSDRFSEDGIQILKFHGSYQQYFRDKTALKDGGKSYSMMLRTRNPGGFISPQLYLALDQLADQYGSHTLRATTRQGFQLHGVLKKNLKTVIATIVNNMGSTLGACGDLNRNVMAPAAIFRDRPEYVLAQTYANHIADLLTPQTGAYYEIWLDGEKAVTSEPHPDVLAALQRNGNGTVVHDSEEPIYGTHYMPRKFKCAITVPGDNSVDLFSQDVSLVVITNAQGELEGFNVYAGGGLGRTHNKEETFARIADKIGYVDKADIYDLLKAIVATQRDYGDRTDRRHARMKYLIHDWGVDKFRTQVEQYFGKKIQSFRPLPDWKFLDHLGWHEQGDGKLFVGISVENGRVKDEGNFKLKTVLRQIVQKFSVPMRVTPSQDVLIYDINPSDKVEIQTLLKQHGIKTETELDPIRRTAMACPALPTCGLAIAESERALPSIIDRLRTLLDKVGLKDEQFIVRMTGCPNGCARPYLAELGFVGQSNEMYQVWLGASPNQTRLSQPFMEKMAIADLEITLEPLFIQFKQQRKPDESFGDFCDRVGFDGLRQFSASYSSAPKASAEPQASEPSNPASAEQSSEPAGESKSEDSSSRKTRRRHRMELRDDLYEKLQEAAKQQGKPMTEVAHAVLEEYLRSL
jgi:sulfite reductase (ferredoxin)